MRIHYFQHVAFEGLGCIERWANERGHALTSTPFYAGAKPPASVDEYDFLVVLGGPMNIYEEAEFPWLADEKQAIRRAIDASKIVLGVCLGAQLLADVLGARVYRNALKEIGWFPIQTLPAAKESPLFATWPERFTVLHWHGDTFGLPEGAKQIAKSAACEQQAYQYGDRVVGLQFHLDFTPDSVVALSTHCANELVAAPYIQSAETMLADRTAFTTLNQTMFDLLDRLAALA